MEIWKTPLKLGILLTIFSINSYADPLDVVKPEINSIAFFGGKWHINYNELKNGTNLLKEELFVDGNSDRIVTVGTEDTRGFALHGSYATDVCHKAYVVVYDKAHSVVAKSDEFDFGDTTTCGDYVEPDDTVAPVLTLIGQNPQRVTKGQSYEELGAIALDNRDGDLTNSIVIDSSNVDTSTLGDYTVIYDVVDAAGHDVTVTRTVKVVTADYMGELEIHSITFYGGKWNIRYQDLRKVKNLKKEILFVDGAMVRILTGGYNAPYDRGFAFAGAYAQDACHKAYIVAYDIDDNELSKSAVFEFGDTTKCVEANNDYKITNIAYFGGKWNIAYKDVPVSSEYSVEKLYVNNLLDRTVNAGTTSPTLNRGFRLLKSYAQDKCHKAYIELFNNVGVKVKTTESFNFGDLSKCGGDIVPPSNHEPVANAGDDKKNISKGAEVHLSGNASYDVDGDTLSYLWSFVSKPNGSSATLSDATIVNPTFIADENGTYTIQLIVNDGYVNSNPDMVLIETDEDAPKKEVNPTSCTPEFD